MHCISMFVKIRWKATFPDFYSVIMGNRQQSLALTVGNIQIDKDSQLRTKLGIFYFIPGTRFMLIAASKFAYVTMNPAKGRITMKKKLIFLLRNC